MEAQESAVRWIEVRNGERRYSTVCGFEGMCPQREERESRKEKMREWLSGGVSPCQGEGRGFESRLALRKNIGNVDFTAFPFLCLILALLLQRREPFMPNPQMYRLLYPAQ